MQNFNWSKHTHILFGKNKIEELSTELKKLNVKKVLLTYGYSSIKKIGLYDEVLKILASNNITVFELPNIDPNPRYTSVLAGASICKKEGIDLILAVGGGSVVDCSKGIALATYYEGDFWNDIVKKAQGGTINKVVPIACILTLAATGTEMNEGGVISNLETKEKLGLSSPLVAPRFSILDPQYTLSVPKNQIAAGIVDAFSHCLEQYFSSNDDAIISDNILVSIMAGLIEISQKAFTMPNDYNSHANLMWGATMALNGISGVGKQADWSTHSIEHAVSAYYDITHAVGLAIIFPNWMEYVLDEKNAYRFRKLSVLFGIKEANEMTCAKQTILKISEFFNSLEMPSTLSAVGVKKEDIDGMVVSTFARYNNGTIGSFKALTKEDVKVILTKSY